MPTKEARGKARACGPCYLLLRPGEYEPEWTTDPEECSVCGDPYAVCHRVSWAEVDSYRRETDPRWSTAALVERIKANIIQDVRDGTVPAMVGSYSELHDYVDANCYGNLCDGEAPIEDDWFMDRVNAALDAVDAWIKEGGLR